MSIYNGTLSGNFFSPILLSHYATLHTLSLRSIQCCQNYEFFSISNQKTLNVKQSSYNPIRFLSKAFPFIYTSVYNPITI
uniref:Uncharacterized protein n=1 Tax=Helianthus annuus TaxID=4232 RepID=A0A251TE67_HELAN